MSERRYEYLYNKNGDLTHHTEAIRGEDYCLYKGDEFHFTYKQGDEREYFVSKIGFKNPLYIGNGGGGESVEHYNAKMDIVYNKKYYDTIFKKEILFDEVIPEKSHQSKKPDLSCYVNGKLVMCIEIYNTNKKTNGDIEELKQLGVPITEININNENRCEHIVLPRVLEANREKYNKLIWQYKELKRTEGEFNSKKIDRVKQEIESAEERHRNIIKESESIYYSVINEQSELKKRITRIREEQTEFNRTKKRIENLRGEISTITEKLKECKETKIEDRINNFREQIRKIKGNIAWQNNRSRQANTIIKRGF